MKGTNVQLKVTTAIATLAIVAASAASNAGPLASFTEENVGAALKGAGAMDVSAKLVETEPRLTFKFGDATYVADLVGCKGAKGCEGLHFMAAFDPSATDTIEAVNAFNDKYVYGKAALEKSTRLLVSMRMVNGGGGSSTEQIADELVVFIGMTNLLLTHMKESGQTVSYPSSAPTAAFVLRPHQDSGPSKWNTLPHNRRR